MTKRTGDQLVKKISEQMKKFIEEAPRFSNRRQYGFSDMLIKIEQDLAELRITNEDEVWDWTQEHCVDHDGDDDRSDCDEE